MYPVSSWRGPAFRALALSVLALAGLAGCTMVDDSLTGISMTREARGTCINDCADAALTAMEAEQQLHLDNVAACQTLPSGEIEACVADEGVRHAAAMQSIADAKRECQNNCHSQGQGGIG
jgi:hypothetical protein